MRRLGGVSAGKTRVGRIGEEKLRLGDVSASLLDEGKRGSVVCLGECTVAGLGGEKRGSVGFHGDLWTSSLMKIKGDR